MEKKLSDKELNKMCAIGRAAAKLFDKKGYLETSLKDISATAKLSKGGIYHYFSSKHQILYFVLDKYMDLLLDGLEEDLEKIPDPGRKIEFILYRHLKLYSGKLPEAKALLIDGRNLPANYFQAIAAKQKRYAQILTDVLSDYFDGKMETAKLKAISYTMFGMCNSIMYWYDPKGAITLEELSRISYDIYVKGIRCYREDIAQNASADDELSSEIA